MIGLDVIVQLTGGRLGVFDVPCPLCSPSKSPTGQRRLVMRIWRDEPGFASFHCARCGEKGYAREYGCSRPPDPMKLAKARAMAAEREREITKQRLDLSRWLRRRQQPIVGSIGEHYLREARGYRGPLPATLGFLPPLRDHPPAVIAAFGMAHEITPGEIAIEDDAVVGVHLIKLESDGSDRLREIEDAKVTIGRGFVAPIVLAPPTICWPSPSQKAPRMRSPIMT